MIVKIATDGTVEKSEGPNLSLADMQAAVGGYIELLYVSYDGDPNAQMYVNEDGKREGLPVNAVATELFRESHPAVRDFIVGPVLIYTGRNAKSG